MTIATTAPTIPQPSRNGQQTGQTSAGVLEAVSGFACALPARSRQIEQERGLPADVVGGLRATGVFRMWLPRELGGLEASAQATVDAIEMLSAADASTGWCTAIGVASNALAAFLPREGATDVYRTGDEIAAGALMPTGRAAAQPDGSLSVTGRWSFGSGVSHSDWIAGLALTSAATGDSGAPEPYIVMFPRAAVEIIDTWHVSGLAGTGSNDYQVSGVTVPARHCIPLAELSSWAAGSMWRIPLYSLVFPLMAAVPLGIARRAVAELSNLATTKVSFRSARPLGERESTQIALARAQAATDAGHLFLVDAMSELRRTADTGSTPDLAARARARLAAVHATQTAAEAVQACYRCAGTSAISLDNPLQRALRDVNAATQHYTLSHNGYETVGRVMVGLASDVPL